MVSPTALSIFALLLTGALGEETCDASNPEKCTFQGERHQPVEGNILLQAGVHHTKSRSKVAHHGDHGDEDDEPEDHSQFNQDFDELEKHAKFLVERVQFLQNDPEAAQDRLHSPEVDEKMQKAEALLAEVQKGIKNVRGQHAVFIQSPALIQAADTNEARGRLQESMLSVMKMAKEAEGLVADVDDEVTPHGTEEDSEEDAEEEDEQAYEEAAASLLQVGEEDYKEHEEEEEEDEDHEENDHEDEEHDHEDEDEEHEDANEDEDEDAESLIQEDEEDHEEEDEGEEDHEEHEEEEDEHDGDNLEEMQKGTGVEYEDPEEEEKTIEKHIA